LDGWAEKSYSQEGEDMILRRIFGNKGYGFYVDVGAHHPKRFSNTYYFYKKGWRGINIDAMPGSMALFSKLRSKDINLETPIGIGQENIDFYVFDEPALNGFDEKLSKSRDANTTYKIKEVIVLNPRMLKDVLAEYLPSGVQIDFMTIDVEGLDMEVLQSNDWEKYRPEVVLVETLELSLDELQINQIHQFMCNVDYRLYAKAVNTVIYKRFS
jgi:hypothetical protein